MAPLIGIAGARAFAALVPRGVSLLGIDPGSLKCGFSVRPGGDLSPQRLGIARAPRASSPSERADIFARVTAELVAKHGVRGIIMGWPNVGMSPHVIPGGVGASSVNSGIGDAAAGAHARALASALSIIAPMLPLLLWDEHGSSVLARADERTARAKASFGSRANRALPRNLAVDDAAAMVILQSYIDATESWGK